jgi:hypothetical protein
MSELTKLKDAMGPLDAAMQHFFYVPRKVDRRQPTPIRRASQPLSILI